MYVGCLRPYYASDALAAAPYFKENSVDYADFSEYKISEKIVEKKVTREGASVLGEMKAFPRQNIPGKRELK